MINLFKKLGNEIIVWILDLHAWVTLQVKKYTKPSHFMLGQAFYLFTFFWLPHPILTLVILATIKESIDWFVMAGHPFLTASVIKFIKTEWWFDTGWYVFGAVVIDVVMNAKLTGV